MRKPPNEEKEDVFCGAGAGYGMFCSPILKLEPKDEPPTAGMLDLCYTGG